MCVIHVYNRNAIRMLSTGAPKRRMMSSIKFVAGINKWTLARGLTPFTAQTQIAPQTLLICPRGHNKHTFKQILVLEPI